MELKYNDKTGIVEAWEDGKKVGEVVTMGNDIIEETDTPPQDVPKELLEKFGF